MTIPLNDPEFTWVPHRLFDKYDNRRRDRRIHNGRLPAAITLLMSRDPETGAITLGVNDLVEQCGLSPLSAQRVIRDVQHELDRPD